MKWKVFFTEDAVNARRKTVPVELNAYVIDNGVDLVTGKRKHKSKSGFKTK
ncbi:Arm DNA-binding domain-containing protein [Peribacillus butanolivorans]|uniref:Arm DNA-binding domain-containing protein n=1 Tax=Peribacillus butanolivorans TaxID=421767 RepID=UPI00367741EB